MIYRYSERHSHQTHACNEEQRGGLEVAQETVEKMEEKVEEVEEVVVEVEPREMLGWPGDVWA